MDEPIVPGKGTNSGINEHHKIVRGFPHEFSKTIHLFKIVTALPFFDPLHNMLSDQPLFLLHGNIEGTQDGHAEGNANPSRLYRCQGQKRDDPGVASPTCMFRAPKYPSTMSTGTMAKTTALPFPPMRFPTREQDPVKHTFS